jgi:hypothetical protein
MRIGRTGTYICDNPQCEKVIAGRPNLLREDDKEVHFCKTPKGKSKKEGCMYKYLFEYECAEEIVDRVEAGRKVEFKLIYDQVCPACRCRLRRLE